MTQFKVGDKVEVKGSCMNPVAIAEVGVGVYRLYSGTRWYQADDLILVCRAEPQNHEGGGKVNQFQVGDLVKVKGWTMEPVEVVDVEDDAEVLLPICEYRTQWFNAYDLVLVSRPTPKPPKPRRLAVYAWMNPPLNVRVYHCDDPDFNRPCHPGERRYEIDLDLWDCLPVSELWDAGYRFNGDGSYARVVHRTHGCITESPTIADAIRAASEHYRANQKGRTT